MPIGLVDNAPYSSFELKLSPGDRLFLHSDGFTEAESLSGELLGEDGLARIVGSIPDTTALDFTETMLWLLSEHTGHTEFQDDVSGVVLEYRGPDLQEA